MKELDSANTWFVHLFFTVIFDPLSMSSDLIQKICDETGCSRATVYRALKGSELVGDATRQKVQAAARRIGVNFNPLVGEWMSHVRNSDNPLAKEPLVYLSGHTKAQYAASTLLSETWEGAQQRASELGFSMMLWQVEEQDSADRWKEIGAALAQEKVRGVIVSRFPPNAGEVRLPWDSISTVAIGFSARRPPMHTVTSHGLDTVTYCLDLLVQRGYRRPGWVCSNFAEHLGGGRHTADFLAGRYCFPEAEEVPVFRMSIEENRPEDKTAFLEWYHRFRPDVVISGGIGEYYEWLLEAGVSIPEETGFFFLGLRLMESPFSGIRQPSASLGRSAVEMLATLIYHGERGLPERPNIVQTLNPTLHEGRTIRAPMTQ
jgi:LacI family transcriptional regulator